MQWSQIKTLFILSFLILNIYLLIQFIEKQGQADLSLIERHESTIEEQLESDNISVPSLPEEQEKEPFISVRQKVFNDEDLDKFDQIDDQEPYLLTSNFILSVFKKRIEIKEDSPTKDIEEMIRSKMIYPEEYSFWNWNKEMNVLIFFQKKNDRPIYYNRNGMILVYLNDDNETMFYTQTMLGDADARQDKKSLIEPLKAIETIYDAQELRPGDKVTKVEMGFHTRVPLANGVQVFVPTWKVTVNKDENYFVNAIEGFSFSGDEWIFLKETFEVNIEMLKETEIDDKKVNEEITDFIEGKLADMNRSGA